MDTLALKLLLTPALIGAASLAGRHWGPAVSGWLVGFPFTSAPIALFLALNHGASFAAAAAVGTMAGAISQAAFCVAYGRLAPRRGWPVALAGACLAFAASTAALEPVALAPLPLSALVLAGLLAAPRLMPASAGRDRAAQPPPPWDIPARMVVATAFVVLLTGVAPALGPHLTGLLAPFPLYAAVLAIFAQHLYGPAPAVAVLRGLLLGLFAFAGFFLVLATLLDRTTVAAAFAASIATTVAIQGLALWALRRARKPG